MLLASVTTVWVSKWVRVQFFSPWHVDPVSAAGEDEDHAAVAEQGEQEDDPDSTTESPPEDEYIGDDHDLADDNEE